MSVTGSIAAHTASRNSSDNGTPPETPRVPRRRRRWLLAAAVGLIALAVVGNYALITSITHRTPMLVLTHDVSWGQRITPGDLRTVSMLPEASRFALPAAHRSRVVGRVATQNLTAGELLTQGDVTRQVVPAAGQRVVGLRLQPGQYPARGLRANDPIQVIPLAAGSTTDAATPTGAGFRARVVRVSPRAADGAITVDVLIDAAMAEQAASAAAGEVLVMLLGPEQ